MGCDVKPDNLLLLWDGMAVKLCDFGTARFPADLQGEDQLQPLFYRAPEVYLGSTRGRKIDMWSAGLVIFELVTGKILFRSCSSEREVMEKLMQLRGPVPSEMVYTGRLANCYFSHRTNDKDKTRVLQFHPEVGMPVVYEDTYKKTSMFGELAPYCDFGSGNKGQASNQALAAAQLSKL